MPNTMPDMVSRPAVVKKSLLGCEWSSKVQKLKTTKFQNQAVPKPGGAARGGVLGPINNYPPQKSCLRTPFNQKHKVFWVNSLFMPGNIVICTFLGLKSKMAILARTIAPSNF